MSALTFETLSAELTQALANLGHAPSETTARCTLGRDKVMVLVEYPLESPKAEPLAAEVFDWLEQELRHQFDTTGLPEEAADLSAMGSEVSVQIFLKHLSESKPFTMHSFIWKVDDSFDDLFGGPIADSKLASNQDLTDLELTNLELTDLELTDQALAEDDFSTEGGEELLAAQFAEQAEERAEKWQADPDQMAAIAEPHAQSISQSSLGNFLSANSKRADLGYETPLFRHASETNSAKISPLGQPLDPSLEFSEPPLQADELIPSELADEHLHLDLEFDLDLGDVDEITDITEIESFDSEYKLDIADPSVADLNVLDSDVAELDLSHSLNLNDELELEDSFGLNDELELYTDTSLDADLAMGLSVDHPSTDSAADFDLPGESPELDFDELNLPTLDIPSTNARDIQSADADFFNLDWSNSIPLTPHKGTQQGAYKVAQKEPLPPQSLNLAAALASSMPSSDFDPVEEPVASESNLSDEAQDLDLESLVPDSYEPENFEAENFEAENFEAENSKFESFDLLEDGLSEDDLPVDRLSENELPENELPENELLLNRLSENEQLDIDSDEFETVDEEDLMLNEAFAQLSMAESIESELIDSKLTEFEDKNEEFEVESRDFENAEFEAEDEAGDFEDAEFEAEKSEDEDEEYDENDPAYYLEDAALIGDMPEEEPFEDIASIDETEVQRQREQWQQQAQSGNPWIFAGALGFVLLGVLGFGVTRPCTFGQCDRLQTAQETSAEALIDLRENSSLEGVTEAKEQLKRAIGLLSPIPIWSPYYRQAQAVLPIYKDQVQALDYLSAAQEKAYGAAVDSQNPPHPVATWHQIATDWLQASELLEKVPADSPVRELADKKLLEYRANRATILVRIDAESKAELALRQAQQAASLGTKELENAGTLADWEEALKSWELAVNSLSQIPQGTNAHAEAQKLLPEYLKKLDEIRDRTEQERMGSNLLFQAKQLAANAQKAETEEQWSASIQNWQSAQNQLLDIPQGTSVYAEAQALQGLYKTSLSKSEKNLQVALRFQPVEPNFFAACGVSGNQKCTYAVTGGNVRLDLFQGYDTVIDQSITPPNERGVDPSFPQLISQSNQLLQTITTLSTQAQVPVKLYDAKGEFLAMYRPDLNGFTREAANGTAIAPPPSPSPGAISGATPNAPISGASSNAGQ